MKFPVILSIVCIGIGIAIGWIAKPTPETAEAEKPQDSPPKISTRKDPSTPAAPVEKSDREPQTSVRVLGGNSPEDMTDEQRGEMKKYSNQFGEMMKKRRMAKLDARISKLVAQLNLTPDQEAALRKAAEESLGNLASIMDGDFDPSKMGSLTGTDVLDSALDEVLTDGQKEEHEALKKRELANKVEAKAMKELAKLSDLDMTQEQKDAAYDILYKQAEENTTSTSAESGIISMVTDGLGIELDIDPGDLGIAGTIVPAEDGGQGGDEAARDPKKIMERMQENRQKRIDKKVEALRPVLNDAQLEQYRKSLEIKNSGLFGGMPGGFGTESQGE